MPIPWTTILTHGPAIVGAAKRLLATTGADRPAEANRTSEARFAQLEQASMESARLLDEMAQQIQALTVAHAQTARMARMAIVAGVAAVAMSVGAGIVEVVW